MGRFSLSQRIRPVDRGRGGLVADPSRAAAPPPPLAEQLGATLLTADGPMGRPTTSR